MRRTPAILAAAALLGLIGPDAAGAQSLLASRGLGLVSEPTDGRGAALGGVTVGLLGNPLSLSNPAEAVGIPVPGFQLSFQYDDFTGAYAGREDGGSTARFPLIAGAFPIGERAALTLGLGGFLDQNWAVQRADTLLVGDDSLSVLDRFTSEGGVARARVGAGYRVLDGLSVGLGVDFYTGSVQRFAGRYFDGVRPDCCETEWSYRGTGFVAGADWQPNEALRVSVAGSVGGTLDAEARDTASTGGSFDLPTTLRAGASARVANDLLVALSADWGGWSSLDGAVGTLGGAQDAWGVRGGVEWEGITVAGRPVPVRLGARQASLPFRWEGADSDAWLTERALGGGVGLVLAGGAAVSDLAFESGTRGDAGLDESFWRMTFSITVLGR